MPVQGVPPSARELEHEAPPLSSAQARPEYQPDPPPDDEKPAEIKKIIEPARPAPSSIPASKPSTSTVTRPTSTASKPTTSPHGTRPATLYYSSGPRKDKEETTPSMKTTPSASPAPTPSTSPPRSTASTLRTASVSDFRSNVERQSREQKSVGDLLSILVYTLIGLFVLGASLSGYGAYVLSKQIQQQSVTVGDLDKRVTDENLALSDQLKTTMTTLSEAQAQIGREQELILKQQETINKLISATQDNANAIKSERATRADETLSIRERLRDLEYRGPTTQKY
jgi:hypothetical protein